MYQRIASAPAWPKNSSGSGKFLSRLESLRPSIWASAASSRFGGELARAMRIETEEAAA